MRSLSYFLGPVLLAATLTACGAAASAAPTETPRPTVTRPTTGPATPLPASPTPTEAALGSAERPIVMALAAPAASAERSASGDRLAQLLADETGLSIKALVSTSAPAMLEAMCSGNSQMSWLPALGYLLAHQTWAKDAAGRTVACAEAAAIALRDGSNRSAAQFVARADSGFSAYPAGSDPNAALKQLDGKQPCWTDLLSASGYIIPARLAAAAGARLAAAAFVQSDAAVIRAVYARGICDFGATAVDARADPAIQADLPDVNDQVRVIYQTERLIPNETLSYAYDAPPELRARLTAAVLKLAGTQAGAAAIRQLYAIDGLQAIDDTFFDEFRAQLADLGFDLAALIR